MGSFNYEVTSMYEKHLYEEYGDYFEDVKSVCPNFDKNAEVRLGVLLENVNQAFDQRFQMNEDNGVTITAPNVINGLKTQYFDIITAVFPNLIAEELFSVQPLKQKMGQIFYLRYVYGTTKGNVNKGDTIFSHKDIAGYENRYYTSDHIEDEELGAVQPADKRKDFNLEYYPVAMNSLQITLGSDIFEDDANGNLINLQGKKVGWVDYSTGLVTLLTAVETEEQAYATYDSTFENKTERIPSIEVQIDSTSVTAKPRKLRGTYSLDAGYDLQQSQGIDIKEALAQAAAMTLKNETDGDLIKTAFDQAGRVTSWTYVYDPGTSGYSKKEYYEDFIDHIFSECSEIRKKTKRVGGNFIVCGKTAGDILTFIGAPRFVGSGNTEEVGPYYAGMLDNRIKVYINPFFDDDDYLIGYKGSTLIDAGLIYAPYLLFFATEPVMLDDFIGRRGFSTIYAKKMVNRDLYIRGKIVRKPQADKVSNSESVTTNENQGSQG